MNFQRIKSRTLLFTFNVAEWDLNIQLIQGKKYNYLIDTGLGSLSMVQVLEPIKDDPKPIVVINTHYHWDHVWGNHVFKNALIVSHKTCSDLIASNWDGMIEKNRKYIAGEAELCLPNLLFDHELYFPEDGIRLFHSPGHTVDSISVLDEHDKILNAADNIGDNMEEIIPQLFDTKDTYVKTLENYKTLDFDVLLSGHNRVLDKSILDSMLASLA